MADSKQLLAEYARTGSEEAFPELVVRYIDLVYSAAMRLLNNDSDLGQDVAQRCLPIWPVRRADCRRR